MNRNPDGSWDKSKLPSRHVTEGPARAPHRSYYYAMGLGTREISQPFVGVASCWNEAAPCNTALMRQAHAVSQGVKAAGATPREFCTRCCSRPCWRAAISTATA
jgi:dihydroxy-acid dehydratase